MRLFFKWLVFVMVPRWLIVALRSDIPRRPSKDPTKHTDYEIGWALQDGWAELVEEHVPASAGDISGKEAVALRRVNINVAFVDRREHDEAIAFVRPSVSLRRLPDAALGLLLGVPAEAARAIDQAMREENPGLISPMHVLVSCHFRQGRWRPIVVDLDELAFEAERQSLMAEVYKRQTTWKQSAALDSELYVAIGESVQIQTDLKEPPFAVMVLGPAESVDDKTVRVPVRITAIVPRWSLSSIGGSFLTSLQTEPGERGESVSWSNLDTSPSPYSPGFEDVILVKGGSHEIYLYFRADDDSRETTVPHLPFTEMHYFDGSEQIIASDLTRTSPIPERARLDAGSLGALWDDPPVEAVGARLSGGQWGHIPTPPKAGIGDTVRATTFTDWPNPGRDKPSYDITVLGLPQVFDDRAVRLHLRITSLEDGLSLRALEFQLSSGPDTYGRIHHLWESRPLYEENPNLPDSLPDAVLEAGQTAEGHVYFPAPHSEHVPPGTALTILWHGDTLFEQPITLA